MHVENVNISRSEFLEAVASVVDLDIVPTL